MKQVGATNAMRMEAVARDGRKVVLKYAHEDLEVCVGIATAAFVVATLKGDVSAAALLCFVITYICNLCCTHPGTLKLLGNVTALKCCSLVGISLIAMSRCC